MRVNVKLYGLLRPYHPGPNRSALLPVDVADGATSHDVIASLKLPPQLARLVFINDRQAKLDDRLREGDRLAFFSSLVGG
jgi:sulfur carrier protein ThiS